MWAPGLAVHWPMAWSWTAPGAVSLEAHRDVQEKTHPGATQDRFLISAQQETDAGKCREFIKAKIHT